jgi:uncharacterized membrane protein
MYSLCVIGFLWRFIPPRHTSPTTLDRFALTIYAFSVAATFVLPQDKAMLAPVFGSVPLIITWMIYRWTVNKHSKQRIYAE